MTARNPGPPWVHSDHVAAAVGTAYGDGLREGAENERYRLRPVFETLLACRVAPPCSHCAKVVADLFDGEAAS